MANDALDYILKSGIKRDALEKLSEVFDAVAKAADKVTDPTTREELRRAVREGRQHAGRIQKLT